MVDLAVCRAIVCSGWCYVVSVTAVVRVASIHGGASSPAAVPLAHLSVSVSPCDVDSLWCPTLVVSVPGLAIPITISVGLFET